MAKLLFLRLFLGLLLVFCILLGAREPARANQAVRQDKEKDKASLSDLSLEVTALQILHYFQITPAQMKELQKMSQDTAAAQPDRNAGKGSKGFRKALTELRNALVENDADKIDEANEKVQELREKESPELEDGVELTDEARGKAGAAFKMLNAGQIVSYLASAENYVWDPQERMVKAMEAVRGVKAEEWKTMREETGQAVGLLLAGVDVDKSAKIGDKVIQLLIVARSLKDDEFKAQKTDLEKAAREIAGEVKPMDVIRNGLEHVLAEMLSNPRLGSALELRLKKGAKE